MALAYPSDLSVMGSYRIDIQVAKTFKTSYYSYAEPAKPCSIWLLGPLLSDSVIKLVLVLFGKCTTLAVTKCYQKKPDYRVVTNESLRN